MISICKFLFILLYINTIVQAKTIRSKIHTNENGTKELTFANGSDVNQQEIDFLIRNLNEMNIMTLPATQTPPTVESTLEPSDRNEKLKETILMQHWNSLTEAGWRNFTEPRKKLYLNSTRELRLAPEFRETEGGAEKNATAEETSGMFDLCRLVIDLCQIAQPEITREAVIGCLALRNKTLLEEVEGKLEKNETLNCPQRRREEVQSPRTFIRPRRLLQKVLLPLLVILVIKYLVTLPFVTLSVFTLNAMWLGLLSIGAVIFAKFKGHDYLTPKVPHRRIASIPGGEVYDVPGHLTASDIIWSPIRVPLGQTTISTHS